MRRGFADGDDLSMSSGVIARNGGIPAAAHDIIADHDQRADRDLAGRFSFDGPGRSASCINRSSRVT